MIKLSTIRLINITVLKAVFDFKNFNDYHKLQYLAYY